MPVRHCVWTKWSAGRHRNTIWNRARAMAQDNTSLVDFGQITTNTIFYVYSVVVDLNGTPSDRTDDKLTIGALVYGPNTYPNTNNQIVHQAQSDGFKDEDLNLNPSPTLQLEYVAVDRSGFVGKFGNLYFYYSNIPLAPGSVVPITPTEVFDPQATCFLRGTCLETPRGPVPVEELKAGDLLTTRDGGASPIAWIGRSSYATGFVIRNEGIVPVRIRAGGLGRGLPLRDLIVSPRHGILLDGALVPAICLVNGETIVQEITGPVIDYFHVELDRHDCVLAAGVWSESFLDNGSRFRFHNAAAHDGTTRGSAIPYPAPLVEAGPELARRLVALRAATAIAPRGHLVGCVERINPELVSGWAQDLDQPEQPVIVEAMLDGVVLARTVALGARADVAQAGFRRVGCGFELDLPPGLLDAGSLPRLVVRRHGDGVALLPPTALNLAAA